MDMYTRVDTNGCFSFSSLPSLPLQDNHSVVSHVRQQKDETLKEVRSVCQTLQDTMKKDQEQRKLAGEEHSLLFH